MMPGICASLVSRIRVSDNRECPEFEVSMCPEMLLLTPLKHVWSLFGRHWASDKYIYNIVRNLELSN